MITFSVAEMPEAPASVRRNQIVMDYMRIRDDARKAEESAALAVATGKETIVEASLKGTVVNSKG